MNEPAPKISAGVKAMAFVCRICPMCVACKIWPDSGYTRMMRAWEKECPFCKAHAKVQEAEKNKDHDFHHEEHKGH